jgi:hypothetical protein
MARTVWPVSHAPGRNGPRGGGAVPVRPSLLSLCRLRFGLFNSRRDWGYGLSGVGM